MFCDIKNLKKSIISNLALCYSKKENYGESVKYDEIIIFQMDKNYEKSYIRLIQSYISMNNAIRAEQIREIVKK